MARLGSITSATDITAGSGGATQALMETRAAAIAATIDVAVKSLRTAGYAAPGDGGDGLYKRVNALPGHAGFFRSADRFLADGTTNSTNGGYWELVPEGGLVNIEQFGGKASATVPTSGSPGADNYQPLLDAMSMATFVGYTGSTDNWFGPDILFGVGHYYFSQTININRIVRIKGVSIMTTSNTGHSTQWWFPVDTAYVYFQGGGTGPGDAVTAGLKSGAGAEINGISMLNFRLTSTGGNLTKHGIVMRGRATVRNCQLFYVGGTGIKIHAYAGSGGASEGNANCWYVENCFVESAGLHGLHVSGSDANAGLCVGFTTKTIGYCGILDESYFGNTYIGLTIEGYGHRGVEYPAASGHRYILVNDAGLGATTTPGGNPSVWHDYGIGWGSGDARWPVWTNGGTYVPSGPIYSFGNSNCSVFVGHYVEGEGLSHIDTPGRSIGGLGGAYSLRSARDVPLSGGSFIGSAVGVGGYRGYYPGSTGYTNNGELAYVAVGNASAQGGGPEGGMNVFAHSRGIDGNYAEFYYQPGTGMMRYSWNGGTPMWEVTTPVSVQQFGRGVAQRHKLVLFDPVLQNPDDGNHARVIGMKAAAPTTGAHAQGEFYFNVAPTAGGTFGWSCITSGTPGTWKAIPVPA